MKKIKHECFEKSETESSEKMRYIVFENENQNENINHTNSINTIQKELLNPMKGPLNFFEKNETKIYSSKENFKSKNKIFCIEELRS